MPILRFKDGEATPDEWPEFATHECKDDQTFLEEQGFKFVAAEGDPEGMHFITHKDSASDQFVVIFLTSEEEGCFIRCTGWPDYLEMLSMLSQITGVGKVLTRHNLHALDLEFPN